MDEMRISTKFMQNLISKIIRKVLNKKLGMNPEISFGSPIELKIDGDTAQIHVDITANVPTEEILKLIKDYI